MRTDGLQRPIGDRIGGIIEHLSYHLSAYSRVSAPLDFDEGARPRRDRDACSNVFDSMESVAKEKLEMPQATFGQVVTHIRQRQALNEQVVGLLEAINTLRNRNFGHGMVDPFSLTGPEVDFIYLTCIGAILLLARTP